MMEPAILLHVYRMFSEPSHCPWLWLLFQLDVGLAVAITGVLWLFRVKVYKAGCSMQTLVYFVMLRIYPADIYTEMERSPIRLSSLTGNFLCWSTFFSLCDCSLPQILTNVKKFQISVLATLSVWIMTASMSASATTNAFVSLQPFSAWSAPT